jgi:hypothetical protein
MPDSRSKIGRNNNACDGCMVFQFFKKEKTDFVMSLSAISRCRTRSPDMAKYRRQVNRMNQTIPA